MCKTTLDRMPLDPNSDAVGRIVRCTAAQGSAPLEPLTFVEIVFVR